MTQAISDQHSQERFDASPLGWPILTPILRQTVSVIDILIALRVEQ